MMSDTNAFVAVNEAQEVPAAHADVAAFRERWKNGQGLSDIPKMLDTIEKQANYIKRLEASRKRWRDSTLRWFNDVLIQVDESEEQAARIEALETAVKDARTKALEDAARIVTDMIGTDCDERIEMFLGSAARRIRALAQKAP